MRFRKLGIKSIFEYNHLVKTDHGREGVGFYFMVIFHGPGSFGFLTFVIFPEEEV